LVADLTQDEAIDRARAIAVESYDVFLDLTAEPVLSRTEVRFRWLRPDASAFAELRTQGVRGVTLDGASLPPPQDGRLPLSRAGDGDQAVLVVEAAAGYSHEGRGLSRFSDPADGASYVMAMCYPDCGPELFCCFDQPDLTATFRFAARVPDGWECVANGQLAAREGDVCTFTPVSGMRPYDLTFCAGPFPAAARAQAGGTEVTVRHRHSLLGQTAVAPLPQFLGYARDAVAWYADNLRVPCPYPAYDIVFMPDLPALALSVPGLLVVNERLLGRPADAGDQFSAMICAHEVAHLWFGCMVGPRWWDDVWLDEAMASYLSDAALAAIAGVSESVSWTGFAYTDKPRAYEAQPDPCGTRRGADRGGRADLRGRGGAQRPGPLMRRPGSTQGHGTCSPRPPARWAIRSAAGDARKLAIGFAASAQDDDQLAALGAWLAGKDMPDGLAMDAELRARILFTLAARGLASAADIEALPRLDPVTGEVNRATCLAMRPDLAAKEAAWATALSPGEPARIAEACAAGIWVPAQEELLAGYRDRYFTEALPALAARKPWVKARLSRRLFPVTLISEETIEAANAAEPPDNALRLAVAEQATIMRRRLAARKQP
jgi:hypothetical protein